MLKKILLTPNEKESEPPPGLNIEGKFRRMGILNPAIVQKGGEIDLYSRLIYEEKSGLNSCIIKNQAYFERDEVKIKRDSKGDYLEELIFQSIKPHGERGVEDFRISRVQGEYPFHGFLVNYDGLNARTEYLRSNDLKFWEKFGVWFPNIPLSKALDLVGNQGNGRYKKRWLKEYGQNSDNHFLGTKDCAMFPFKIKDKKGVIIRLLPDIQIVYVNDPIELAQVEFWEETIQNLENTILLERKYDWEESHIGLAGPPFEIKGGVLIPYHGAVMKPHRDYKFGLVLVDKSNPQKILARTERPILEATEQWEEEGVVPGKVIFPTGHAFHKENIYWFYGAGDKYVACLSMKEKSLNEYF